MSIDFLRILHNTIKRINPDVINSHSSRTLRYLIVLPITKKYKIVHTITNNPKVYNPKLYYLYKYRMHQKSWNITFVGISDIVSDTLSQVYSYDRKKIETIYNGIKLVGTDKNVIKNIDLFTCAGLTDVKNQTLLIKVMSRLQDLNLNLYIAGDGPNMARLKKEAHELGIADSVVFLGNVENPYPYYKRARYFVLSSLSEGNPLCVIEAMSAGLPVISSSVGGVPDLIEENVNGFLFNINDDLVDIEKKFRFALDISEEVYEQIGMRNISKSEKWNIRSITKQYNELYQRVWRDI